MTYYTFFRNKYHIRVSVLKLSGFENLLTVAIRRNTQDCYFISLVRFRWPNPNCHI
jgi:hypothetical protein